MNSKLGSTDIQPNFSLREFARVHLTEDSEWAEYEAVVDAPAPKHIAKFEDGMPFTRLEVASPQYLRRVELHDRILERLRKELSSGDWKIRALPPYRLQMEEIAPAALVRAGEVSFIKSRIGELAEVQVIPVAAEDRYTKLKWFIEQVCSVVPPKSGLTKPRIEELAERLFDFDVRGDVFKAAWDGANIPRGYRQPGR